MLRSVAAGDHRRRPHFSRSRMKESRWRQVHFRFWTALRTPCRLSRAQHSKGFGLECTVGVELPEWVRADPTRLRQVLIICWKTAVKFTEQGEVTLGRVICSGDGERPRQNFSVTGRGGDTESAFRQEIVARSLSRFNSRINSVTRPYGERSGLSISAS